MDLTQRFPELSTARGWQQPEMFDLSTKECRADVEVLLDTEAVTQIIDPIDVIAADLYDYNNPEESDDETAKISFCKEIQDQGDEFGKWFYFPWSRQLVRYADQADHQMLRTARNRDLITPEEQRKLFGKTVVVVGLSVGSNAMDGMVQGGIGGKFITADMDILKVPNLNRLNADATQLGMSKVDIRAKRTSKIDPYLKQVHLSTGIHSGSLEKLQSESPDIIIEEVDDMAVMALLRVFAQENHLPLITGTDVDTRSIIDIERHDLSTSTRLFNGKLSDKDVAKLLNDRDENLDTTSMMLKHIGLGNVSLRMMQSSINREDLGDSFPQLGTTAVATGALVAVAAREILLGKKIKSGRYVENARKTLHMPREHTAQETAKILRDLAGFIRG